MSAPMRIVLEGLPERVQEAADVLDQALPGLMTWRRFAEPRPDHMVRLEGVTAKLFRPPPLTNRMPVSDKAWTLSSVAGRGSPPRSGGFCASLSKALSS